MDGRQANAHASPSFSVLPSSHAFSNPPPFPSPYPLPQHPSSKEAVSISERMAAEGEAVQEPETSASQLMIDASSFTAGDIALLLLDSPVDSLVPVGLASQSEWQGIAKAGLELRSIGWGATDAGHSARSFPTRLQETALPLVSDKR